MLKRSYLYAIPFILIGLAVVLFWFKEHLLWYLIAVAISVVNYFLLIRIQNYEEVTQSKVLLTLFIRYIIFGASIFIIIWINRDSPDLVAIGIVLAIGISVMKLAVLANKLISKKGSDEV